MLGLYFNKGVVCQATEYTQKERILSFQQLRGMIMDIQLIEVAQAYMLDEGRKDLNHMEHYFNYPSISEYVKYNYLTIIENYYGTPAMNENLIYQMTHADGELAVKCVGYYNY